MKFTRAVESRAYRGSTFAKRLAWTTGGTKQFLRTNREGSHALLAQEREMNDLRGLLAAHRGEPSGTRSSSTPA